MAEEIANVDLNHEFTKYLRVRSFGLVAEVDRPGESEHFPMASGVVIESKWGYVLITAAHFLEDVRRWRDEGRLLKLSLLVHHESGICAAIAIDLEKNLGSFCQAFDFGFLLLDSDVVLQIEKRGGSPMRRDNLSVSADAMKNFYLIGLASAYCPVVTETIATRREGSKEIAWQLNKLAGFAVAISKLQFDGEGTDPGTFRFVPIKLHFLTKP